MAHKLLLVALAIFLLLVAVLCKPVEAFSMDTTGIPVQTHVKYKQAYYYELDDRAFAAMMRGWFGLPGDKENKEVWACSKGREQEASAADPPAGVVLAFGKAVVWLRAQIDAHGAQVLDEALIKYNDTEMTIEMIVYREGHYRAKHVLMEVVVSPNANPRPVHIEVIGSVSEDVFGMYPVEGNQSSGFSPSYGSISGASSAPSPPSWFASAE